MSQPLDVIIVEKGGSLKALAVKDFKLDELYKKCGGGLKNLKQK